VTHHRQGAGGADGCAGNAEHDKPPAYQGQLLWFFRHSIEGDFVGTCVTGGDHQ